MLGVSALRAAPLVCAVAVESGRDALELKGPLVGALRGTIGPAQAVAIEAQRVLVDLAEMMRLGGILAQNLFVVKDVCAARPVVRAGQFALVRAAQTRGPGEVAADLIVRLHQVEVRV